jgi:hypothetical protein
MDLLAKMANAPNVEFLDDLNTGDSPAWETMESMDDYYGGY